MKKHQKFIYALISVVLAMTLWAYTMVYISPKSTMTFNGITVALRGDDVLKARGLILTSGRDQTVNITIGGNRSDLLKLNADNIKLTADLTNITGAGSWNVTYSITYPDTVANGDLVVESRSSSTVQVEVTLATTKTLKPALNVIGTPATGCLLDTPNMTCDMDSVTLYGPSYEIDAITKVQVDVDVSQMKAAENRILEYHLLNQDGDEVNLSNLSSANVSRREGSECTGSEVLVNIPVLPYKELYLHPHYVNDPGTFTVEDCEFQPKKITVVGDAQALTQQHNLLQVDVDLSGVTPQKNTWELKGVISLDSGLVVYPNPEDDFDGVNVAITITVKAKTQPAQTSSSATDGSNEPTEPEE